MQCHQRNVKLIRIYRRTSLKLYAAVNGKVNKKESRCSPSSDTQGDGEQERKESVRSQLRDKRKGRIFYAP